MPIDISYLSGLIDSAKEAPNPTTLQKRFIDGVYSCRKQLTDTQVAALEAKWRKAFGFPLIIRRRSEK